MGGVQRVGKLVAVPMNSKSRETSEQREGGREGGVNSRVRYFLSGFK